MNQPAELHPPLPLALAPTSVPAAAHIPPPEDSPSDSDLSQFEAELTKSLSTASADTLPRHVPAEESDEADSDDETQGLRQGKTRRTIVKEYFDPELYGLRRSVDWVWA
jgi:hypothetical protein